MSAYSRWHAGSSTIQSSARDERSPPQWALNWLALQAREWSWSWDMYLSCWWLTVRAAGETRDQVCQLYSSDSLQKFLARIAKDPPP